MLKVKDRTDRDEVQDWTGKDIVLTGNDTQSRIMRHMNKLIQEQKAKYEQDNQTR